MIIDISTLKRAIKKHDLLYKIFCYFLIKAGFSNKELQALEIRHKRYKKLVKKYKPVMDSFEEITHTEPHNKSNYVWICWFQGLDTAPEIVKKCIGSVYRNLKDKEIHIITAENMSSYVSIPDFIMNKHKRGIISYAQLSDILRTELLIKYGGLWIDATTYVTEDIPDYVYRKNLFLLHSKNRVDLTVTVNSWFIYADKGNRILKTVRDLLYSYWLKENYLGEYFLWHLFVTMAFAKYPEDYKNLDYVSEEMSHWLLYNFFNQYDSVYWEQIKRHSVIHKLSYYKFFTPDERIPEDVKGSFYERFIDGGLL